MADFGFFLLGKKEKFRSKKKKKSIKEKCRMFYVVNNFLSQKYMANFFLEVLVSLRIENIVVAVNT